MRDQYPLHPISDDEFETWARMVSTPTNYTSASITPKGQVKLPVHEQASNASKEAVIAAFRKRIKEPEAENRDLKQQVEVAYGLLAVQTGEPS